MPTELQIIRAQEFVRVGASGKMDLATSRETLMRLAQAYRTRAITRALIDVRGVESNLTPEDLANLIGSFDDLGFPPNQRLALLHTTDPQYRARTFALIGRLGGWKVQAFDSFEMAADWLALDDSQKASEPLEGDPIPIHPEPKSKPGEVPILHNQTTKERRP